MAKVVQDLDRALWGSRHPTRHREQRADAGIGMSRDGVGSEVVRMDDLDPRVHQEAGGVEPGAGVVGDDRVCLADQCRVGDVAVVGVSSP